jgi:hypothetical protein
MTRRSHSWASSSLPRAQQTQARSYGDDLDRGKFLDRQAQRVAGLLKPIKFARTAGAVWLKRCLNLTAWPICTKVLVGRS